MPNEQACGSMGVVEKFVDDFVEQTPKGSQNCPDRLIEFRLHRNEVKSECRDIVFAGTDSAGMSLATLCRYLVLGPQR
jgi:hypothetical protein